MNIILEKNTIKDNIYFHLSEPPKYCCEELKNNKHIILTDQHITDTQEELPAMCFVYEEETRSYEDYWTDTYYIPIRFCPHCGKKIHIDIKPGKDLTKEVNELEEKRDILNKKYRSSDSLKERDALYKQVWELGRTIERYYELTQKEK